VTQCQVTAEYRTQLKCCESFKTQSFFMFTAKLLFIHSTCYVGGSTLWNGMSSDCRQRLIDCNWVRGLAAPMHLELKWWVLCAHFDSWEYCYLTKVPDGPQTYILNILWLQEKGAQMHMLEWSWGFTPTRTWAKVSSSAPHLLQNGLYDSPLSSDVFSGYYAQ
jgi:hypothetical protein